MRKGNPLPEGALQRGFTGADACIGLRWLQAAATVSPGSPDSRFASAARRSSLGVACLRSHSLWTGSMGFLNNGGYIATGTVVT